MTLKNIAKALVASVFCCALLVNTSDAAELKHWPAEAAAKIEAAIKANAHKGEYAVFDMDQTTYRYDLLDPFLAYMDMKGLLNRDTMDPHCKLIPFKDSPQFEGGKENMTSYYWRLCEMHDLISYPWASQIFAGFTLKELKKHLDDMLAMEEPVIKRQVWDGDKVVTVELPIPKMFRGMQELYAMLRENGIEVYIMTAAHEEIVRMIASDPKYGYNIKPENVIGVTVLLKDPKTGELTNARMQVRDGNYDPAKNMDKVTTAFLTNPMTWFEGKQGSSIGYIDQFRTPIMSGGDSIESDTYMLESVDVAKGGVKIWINRKPGDVMKDKRAKKTWAHAQKSAAHQKELGLPVTADKNWIFIDPTTIQ